MQLSRGRLVGAVMVVGVLALASTPHASSASPQAGTAPRTSTTAPLSARTGGGPATRPDDERAPAADAPRGPVRGRTSVRVEPGAADGRGTEPAPAASGAPSQVGGAPSRVGGAPGRGDGVPTRRRPAPPTVIRQPGQLMKYTGTETVALTFDDGPDPRFTPRLLAMLHQHGIKATFCVVGVNVQAHPDLVQAIARDGHSLCNHTWSHDLSLGRRSPETIQADLQRTNDEIRKAVPGATIRYFRHPGGNFTPASTQVAEQLGMASLHWTVDPSDWNTGRYGGGMGHHIVASVQSGTGPGGVILSHDGGGDRSATLYAYQTLLPWLAARFRLIALP